MVAVTTDLVSLTPYQALGIPLALVGAVFLAVGAELQHQGVGKVESRSGAARAGMSVRQLLALLGRPSWVAGTVLLGLAILFQLTSLRLAPLLVVQPLGAVALVVTAVLHSRRSGKALAAGAKRAIALCVGGVGLFVTVAAFYAVEPPIDRRQLVTVLVLLTVVLALFGVLFRVVRRRRSALFYIVGAGVLYGFVATLAKIVLNRVFTGDFDVLTALCLVFLLAAGLLGGYFVQNAYSSGPPHLVIAGLTVVDPLVAVGIGILVLGEATQVDALGTILFLVAGAVAVTGVFRLSRAAPQRR